MSRSFDFENPNGSLGGVPTTRTITAGAGLAGGGDLSANRTVALAPLSPSPAGTFTNLSGIVDQYGRLITAENGVGGSAGTFFDPVALYPTGVGDVLGDYTTGSKYVAVEDIEVLGLNFWRYSNTATIAGKVWRAGSALDSKTLVVSAVPNELEILFDTPLEIDAGQVFWVTTYDTLGAGGRYARSSALSWEPGSWSEFFTLAADGVLLLHPGQYGSGDAQPSTGSSVERYPVRLKSRRRTS